MKFWSKLATWKKVLLVLALLLVLLTTVLVSLAARWWLHFGFGQGKQICIPQGTQTILFTTLASIRAIRTGADGGLEEVSVRMAGRKRLVSPLLPSSCSPGTDNSIPLLEWEKRPALSKRLTEFPCPDWSYLWQLHLNSLETHLVMRTEGVIDALHAFNCLDGRFMAYNWDFAGGGWGVKVPTIFSLTEATFSTIQDPTKLDRGLILLGEQDYVGIGYDAQSGRSDEMYSERPGYLSRRGEKVADNVYDILGVTPDLERVFFVKHESQASGATVSALWTYLPNEGTTQRLMEWKGDRLRVTGNSKRFGFLETEKADQRDQCVIVGAHILDVNGQAIQHFRLEKPIRPTGRFWSYDWSPDWGVIAYFDESDVVIQSLEGVILGRFRIFRLSDVMDYYRSKRKEN
ncbi:MAG TPA: hypothetical protein VM163_10770 [bacterium]|nr:hypothetical protein [bacterium]